MKVQNKIAKYIRFLLINFLSQGSFLDLEKVKKYFFELKIQRINILISFPIISF